MIQGPNRSVHPATYLQAGYIVAKHAVHPQQADQTEITQHGLHVGLQVVPLAHVQRLSATWNMRWLRETLVGNTRGSSAYMQAPRSPTEWLMTPRLNCTGALPYTQPTGL